MMDKEEYFRQLYALNESSDDEQDTNDAREVLKQSVKPISSSSPVSSQPPDSRRSRASKIPAILRTTSAPVSSASVVRETPLPARKASKLHYDKSSNPELNQSSSADAPSATISGSVPERSASTPNLDFAPNLVITNSTGMAALLKRNGTGIDSKLKKSGTTAGSGSGSIRKMGTTSKRKHEKIIVVPEEDKIFAGKTFFFIPNDDISSIRRVRISRARSYGAVWAKEWTPEVTHIVVDKAYNLDQVVNFLTPMTKAESIPTHIIVVNEEYTVDCIEYHTLVDETQERYVVKPRGSSPEEKALQSIPAPDPLQIQDPKSKKLQETPEKHTQQSETPSQPPPVAEMWPPTNNADCAIRDYSPRDRSPMLDDYLGHNDKLDEMIKIVHAVKDLPLDDDDDDEDDEKDRPSSSDGDVNHYRSAEEDHRPRPKKRKQPKKKSGLEYFGALNGGTGDILENNPNQATIDILERMQGHYQRIEDKYRSLAYRRAISTLKKQRDKITTQEQAFELPNIGERIAKKIEEIVLTGRLRRLENAELEPDDHIAQIFLKVYGVGPGEARKLIQAGYKTLDDLRTKADLNRGQKIGLEHYDDFNTRIPRDQVTALGAIVKTAVRSIDPEVQAIIGGSCRRGAETSRDIDFIITKPGTSRSQDLLRFLDHLVDNLTQIGFLTAALATPGRHADSGSKWHGACVLPGNPIWRRIDFLIVPETEFGAALIYFTGDDIFNRSLRLYASTMGYRLNQRGLYKNVMRGPKRKRITEGELVEGRSELRIFEILGVPWREPEKRICH